MGQSDVKYSRDGTIRVEMEAFSHSLVLYRDIGTAVKVRQRRRHSFLGIGSWESWDGINADFISVRNTYTSLPAGKPGFDALPRAADTKNGDTCDERIFSFGLTLNISGGMSPVAPGAPSIEVHSVTGSGEARVNGELMAVGPVATSI